MNSNGDIYFLDSWNNRISCVTASGYYYSVAGCFNGDCKTPTESGILASSFYAKTFYGCGIALSADEKELYLTDWPNHNIHKIGPLSTASEIVGTGDITFVDGDLLYVMSQSGKHKYTADVNTGKVLTSFAYDNDGNLVSSTDRFGNAVTIERDSDGQATAVVAPHGQRTELSVDTDGLLQTVTFEDNTGYAFTYTDEGLMTAETDPNGSLFTHEFDEYGRLTAIKDPEGGEISITQDEEGDTYVRTLITAEGDTTTYTDTYGEGDAFSTVITGPSGAVKTYELDTSGMSGEASLPCGTDTTFAYALNPLTQEKYLSKNTQTLPSGKKLATTRSVAYEDADSDDLPDSVTWTAPATSVRPPRSLIISPRRSRPPRRSAACWPGPLIRIRS